MALGEFALDEMPQRIKYVARGRGFDIFNFNDNDYLLNYSKDGEPKLLGRVIGITRIGKKYITRYMPESDLNGQERTDIYVILAKFWS